MNERNEFSKSPRYIVLSLLLPILSAGAVCLGLYINYGLEWHKALQCICYVFCYAFIFLFYIGNISNTTKMGTVSCIITGIIPAICFFMLYFGIKVNIFPIIAIVLFLMVTLMCTIADFPSALILLAAIAGYTYLFVPSVTTPVINILLYLFLACILVNSFDNIASLIISVAVSVVFFCIICLMNGNFVIEDSFGADNYITCVVSNILLIGIYFVKKLCAVEDEGDAVQKTVNGIPLNTSNEQPKESSKAARLEISRLKEELRKKNYEYDKLKTKHDSIVANSNEFDSQLSNIQLEIDRLKRENTALDEALEEVKNNTTASFEDLVSPEFDYINNFKRESYKLFKHSQNIAAISREAAGLIGCDEDFAYIIGMYHEAPRYLGDDYATELLSHYHVPKYIVRIIEIIKDKNNILPMPREAGIVMLTDDIISTSNYLKSKQNETVPLDRIVTNTIKVRKDQNVLRLAGFSNEEIQLLKLYYIESGGNNDTAD